MSFKARVLARFAWGSPPVEPPLPAVDALVSALSGFAEEFDATLDACTTKAHWERVVAELTRTAATIEYARNLAARRAHRATEGALTIRELAPILGRSATRTHSLINDGTELSGVWTVQNHTGAELGWLRAHDEAAAELVAHQLHGEAVHSIRQLTTNELSSAEIAAAAAIHTNDVVAIVDSKRFNPDAWRDVP